MNKKFEEFLNSLTYNELYKFISISMIDSGEEFKKFEEFLNSLTCNELYEFISMIDSGEEFKKTMSEIVLSWEFEA